MKRLKKTLSRILEAIISRFVQEIRYSWEEEYLGDISLLGMDFMTGQR